LVSSSGKSGKHDNARTPVNPIVKIDDVFVEHADAA
jgi:hypothetical protein